jgi:hypothetical protein
MSKQPDPVSHLDLFRLRKRFLGADKESREKAGKALAAAISSAALRARVLQYRQPLGKPKADG